LPRLEYHDVCSNAIGVITLAFAGAAALVANQANSMKITIFGTSVMETTTNDTLFFDFVVDL
jgi:hypothetical protein